MHKYIRWAVVKIVFVATCCPQTIEVVSQHPSADPLGRSFLRLVFFFWEQESVSIHRQTLVLRVIVLSLLRLWLAKVQLSRVRVASVAIDVAGGESVRNMPALRNWRVRCGCGRCVCRCRPRYPKGWRLPLLSLFLLLLSLLLLLLLMDHRGSGVTFCCSGPEGGKCGP